MVPTCAFAALLTEECLEARRATNRCRRRRRRQPGVKLLPARTWKRGGRDAVRTTLLLDPVFAATSPMTAGRCSSLEGRRPRPLWPLAWRSRLHDLRAGAASTATGRRVLESDARLTMGVPAPAVIPSDTAMTTPPPARHGLAARGHLVAKLYGALVALRRRLAVCPCGDVPPALMGATRGKSTFVKSGPARFALRRHDHVAGRTRRRHSLPARSPRLCRSTIAGLIPDLEFGPTFASRTPLEPFRARLRDLASRSSTSPIVRFRPARVAADTT